MPQNIEDIQQTLASISRGDDLMTMLLELERTLDGTEVFAYKNWLNGELVSGPDIDKYWITTSWMYPHKDMPDPVGGLRLKKIGCEVYFRKDIYKKPVRVLEPSDWADQKTKKAKMEEHPVWIVTIKMPMKYITDRLEFTDAYLEKEMDKITHDIASKYQPDEEAGGDEGGDEFGDEFGDEELGV